MSDGPVISAEELSRIRYDLELFLMGGAFDLYEDARLVATVQAGQASADLSYGKLILSCWCEEWSRSWRVTSCEATDTGLRLRCTKRMGREDSLVELTRGRPSISVTGSRDEFAVKLASMIESNFAGYRVERATRARDDTRHLTGVHARLIIKHRGKTIAAVGCGQSETQAAVDALLTSGLAWVDALKGKRISASRLIIFAPRGRATTLATRLTCVDVTGLAVSLAEVDEASGQIIAVAAFDQGDLADNLRRASARSCWPRNRDLPLETKALIDGALRLAPGVIEARRKGNWVALSIRGLELARVSIKDRRVEFGIENPRKRLDDASRAEFENLIRDVASNRRSDSDSRDDLLYRSQAERWLESLVRADVMAIDPTLDPRYVYSQVPAYRGEHRTFIDLLGATREGRLVVMELKVAEDPEFVFQGLDYWLRVEWHRSRGDFQRRGYFEGLSIADRAPLLYLVAPLLRFHATTRLVASAISTRVPVYRVGINEDWRSGVRVLLTERLN
ncbi:MAG TPA: hypothetical protein VKA70_02735 [Blastocatellia bacterium]|nr:hypothetical protein [Blastocatellia bacterium]